MRPVQRIHGITIASIFQRVELPSDKMNNSAAMAEEMRKQLKVTKIELQRLFSHMYFVGREIRGARTFSRLFIDIICLLCEPHHHLIIYELVRRGLLLWTDVAPKLNGLAVSKFGDHRRKVCINTDASLSGFGVVMGSS